MHILRRVWKEEPGSVVSQPTPTSPEFQGVLLRGIRDPWKALPSHEKIICLSHCSASEYAEGNFPWKTYLEEPRLIVFCTGLEIFHFINYFTVACGKGRANFSYWLSTRYQGTVSEL